MASWKDKPIETGMAFVDTNGKLVDSDDFRFVNLRLSRLRTVLEEMLADGTEVKVLCPTTDGIPPLAIEKLDRDGKLWKVSQARKMGGEEIPNPEVRFFFQRDTGIFRPIDYRDPYVELEGNDKNSQLLIASFMMHWLSGILAFHAEATTCIHEMTEMEEGTGAEEETAQGCPNRKQDRL